MAFLNVFKKIKKNTEPELSVNRDTEQEALLKIILESQAQTIKDIVNNPAELNGITSKKLLDYWLNYKFICYSNDNFKIIIDGEYKTEYRFTPLELAEFTLKELPNYDIIGTAATLSAALDAACLKYSELVDLCLYLQENNLRVRKA